ISYDVTFTIPPAERHQQATFEALTGYMPADFGTFLQFNAATGNLDPLSDGPGEGASPVVLSVAEGSHAMGIYAPPQDRFNVTGRREKHATGPTYGRFRFKAEKVVKWNCVFRASDKAGIAPGAYGFRMFVVVGDVNVVRDSLRALHKKFER